MVGTPFAVPPFPAVMKACKPVRLLLALVLLAVPVSAQTMLFSATLNGAQEVPPVATGGTGSGTLTLNTSTNAWTLTGSFSGLTGTTTDAHIHGPAAPGVDGGVITGISFTSGATSGTFSGSGTFTPTQAGDLMAGLYYINIHTSAFGGGEIRGQLIPVPEPATYAAAIGALTLVAAGIHRRRRRSQVTAV